MLHRSFSSATFDATATTASSCSLQPNDCPCVDHRDGMTELHRLCQDRRASVDEIRQFLRMYPKSAWIPDSYGRTALFYALKGPSSFDAVEMLFRANPEAMIQSDFCRECPLYLLYHRSKSSRILQLVLSERPDFALYRPPTFAGTTLLQRVCAPWQANEVLSSDPVDEQAWNKLVLTVHAAHRARFPSSPSSSSSLTSIGSSTPELHMAIELGLPPPVVARFCRIYPNQASQPMTRHDNMLPLHYVIASERPRRKHNQSTSGKHPDGALIRELLAVYPEAASVRIQGSYPLHLALIRGYTWQSGIQELAYACHNALHVLTESGHCPAQLAAMRATGGDECGDLETIYRLVVERPVFHTKPC